MSVMLPNVSFGCGSIARLVANAASVTPNLRRRLSGLWSSMYPSMDSVAHVSAMKISSVFIVGVESEQISSSAVELMATAIPPPRGVGVVCELLSFGVSIRCFNAYLWVIFSSRRVSATNAKNKATS